MNKKNLISLETNARTANLFLHYKNFCMNHDKVKVIEILVLLRNEVIAKIARKRKLKIMEWD